MFMHRIKLRTSLSLGQETQEPELGPLNVVIGPNGAGELNFLAVTDCRSSAPSDITRPLCKEGSAVDCLRRSEQETEQAKWS